MKKGLSILVASALMCSMAFASPTLTSVEQVGITSSEIQMMPERLNQNDSMVLFGTDKVETIALLSPSEMIDTQGAGWFQSIRSYFSRPSVIYGVFFFTATTLFPPAAMVSIPGVYSGAIWLF